MKKHLQRMVSIPVNGYRYIIFGVIFGTFVYLSMMSNDLMNDLDGIWHTSNFIAGDWEISLGRGLQRYADRARFGLVNSAFNSTLFIFLIALADVYIIHFFKLKKSFSIMFVMYSIANPVICESLSYSYMSIHFALAYLFSVMAFSLLALEVEEGINPVNMALAALLFAVSMAFYQAYMGVYCILAVMYVCAHIQIWDKRKTISAVSQTLILFLMGGIFYFILTKLLLLRAGIELASYRGANSVGVISIITNLPKGIVQCYKEFEIFAIDKNLQSNLEFVQIAIRTVFFIYLLMVILSGVNAVKNRTWKAYMVQIFFIMLIPVAACAVCLVAVGNSITGLMAMPVMLSVGLFPMATACEKQGFTKYLQGVVMIILVWYMLSTVVNDQIALKEGKNSTVAITNHMIDGMIQKGYRIDMESVAFVGRIAENPLFVQSTAYEMANEYAKFGKWSTDARNNRATWIGVVNHLCGVNLQVCDQWTYADLIETESVKAMPVFPAEGSIVFMEDTIVVKVSEVY